MDEKGLSEAISKVAEGKQSEGWARFAKVLVSALGAQFLGPGAVVVGGFTEGTIKRFSEIVVEGATKRMLEAGEKVDTEREARRAVAMAVKRCLDEVSSEQHRMIEELALQGQEEFLQLVTFVRRTVVCPLEEMAGHVAQILEVVKETNAGFRQLRREQLAAAKRTIPLAGAVPLPVEAPRIIVSLLREQYTPMSHNDIRARAVRAQDSSRFPLETLSWYPSAETEGLRWALGGPMNSVLKVPFSGPVVYEFAAVPASDLRGDHVTFCPGVCVYTLLGCVEGLPRFAGALMPGDGGSETLAVEVVSATGLRLSFDEVDTRLRPGEPWRYRHWSIDGECTVPTISVRQELQHSSDPTESATSLLEKLAYFFNFRIQGSMSHDRAAIARMAEECLEAHRRRP